MTQPDQLTEADLARMTPEEIVQAQDEGRCDQLLGIDPEQTALVHRGTHDVITDADIQALAAIGRQDLIAAAYEAGRYNPNGDSQ
jgi:hypothetical protein